MKAGGVGSLQFDDAAQIRAEAQSVISHLPSLAFFTVASFQLRVPDRDNTSSCIAPRDSKLKDQSLVASGQSQKPVSAVPYTTVCIYLSMWQCSQNCSEAQRAKPACPKSFQEVQPPGVTTFLSIILGPAKVFPACSVHELPLCNTHIIANIVNRDLLFAASHMPVSVTFCLARNACDRRRLTWAVPTCTLNFVPRDIVARPKLKTECALPVPVSLRSGGTCPPDSSTLSWHCFC